MGYRSCKVDEYKKIRMETKLILMGFLHQFVGEHGFKNGNVMNQFQILSDILVPMSLYNQMLTFENKLYCESLT